MNLKKFQTLKISQIKIKILNFKIQKIKLNKLITIKHSNNHHKPLINRNLNKIKYKIKNSQFFQTNICLKIKNKISKCKSQYLMMNQVHNKNQKNRIMNLI